MPKVKARPDGGPEYRELVMDDINEPPLPARESMDTTALDELAQSIGKVGLLQPIICVPDGERFEIVAGHRRFLAARQLGWATIKACVYVRKSLATEAAMLHENIYREDLNVAEEAVFFRQLLDKHSFDEAGLCAAVRQSPFYVADRLRLLRGDDQVFEALRQKRINFAVARELNKVKDESLRRYYLDSAQRSGCSSRVVAEWVAESARQGLPQPSPAPADSNAAESAGAEPYRMACFLCGGSLDPYNLESVFIHRWEIERIRKLLRDAAEGGQ